MIRKPSILKGAAAIKKIDPTVQVEKLKRLIERSLDADKAEDIVAIELAGKSSLADYMIVASGTSQRHISTLADHLAEKLRDAGLDSPPMEGKETSDWVVVDAGNIIIHLFRPEMRKHYNIEKMWMMPAMPSMEAAL